MSSVCRVWETVRGKARMSATMAWNSASEGMLRFGVWGFFQGRRRLLAGDSAMMRSFTAMSKSCFRKPGVAVVGHIPQPRLLVGQPLVQHRRGESGALDNLCRGATKLGTS